MTITSTHASCRVVAIFGMFAVCVSGACGVARPVPATKANRRTVRVTASSPEFDRSLPKSVGTSLSSRTRVLGFKNPHRARTPKHRAYTPTASLFGPPPDPKALLTEGKQLYAAGERMQGYKLFEKALRCDDALLQLATRQELLYSCMCCNAAFGDVETAKQFLRDMNIAGLSFDMAMSNPNFMSLEAGAQMRNQLIKFASGEMKSQGTVQREIFEKSRNASPGGSVGANTAGQKPQRMGDMDLMNLDIAGDTSAEAGDIAKRVVGLAVLSIVGFIALFQGGLVLLR